MKVLVVAAHMDDEVLGMGGTIGKHLAAGDTVTVCIVCKRAYDHQFDDALVQEEQEATKRAAIILGYEDIRFLRLRDELLDERLLDVIVPLEECVLDVRPSIVYTHHRGDANQDHRAVCHASLIACRSLSQYKVPRMLAYEVPSSTDTAPPFPEYAFQPNFYVQISDFLKRKIEAMGAYTRELREFPHPRSLQGIEVLARKRGMEVGFMAAEAFMVLRDEWA
jgi:LmbE family N-acetylglucosaminyl deacetylase|tara:strand:- start:8374 stop:9039 length:666 start_codon:yes stop_codon:yes gene_type:complete